MKILRLGLEKYGDFEGASLALASGAPSAGGLSVVYGPNEAGKTTLLDAIRDLLFGFPHVTPYSFRFEPSALALDATLELTGGARVDVRRKRGRGETLRGTEQATRLEVDGDWLSAKLARPTRALFENVFGFSLAGLARGGEMLKSPDVAAALYGSGFGGAQPDVLRKELEELSAGLFAERGKNQVLNASARKLVELRKSLKDVTVRSADFDKQRDVATKTKKEADAAHVELLDARREIERLKAVAAGTATYREMRAARDELREIHVPVALHAGSRAELVRLRADEAARARDLDEAEREARRARDELAAIAVDEGAMREAARIESLYRRVEQHRKSLADLPKRETELRELRRALAARLAEVRPGWSLETLREARLDAAARSDFDDACALHDKATARRTELVARRADAEAEIDRVTRALEAPLPPGDADAARSLLQEWSAFAAERDRLAPAEKALAASARQCAALRRKLDPPLSPDGPDPATLAAPRAEEIQEFERRFEEHARAARTLRDARDAARAKLAEIDAELAGLAADADVPTAEELALARARRERGWQIVDAALRAGAGATEVAVAARAFDAERPLAEAYARAVVEADAVADRMLRAANAVERQRIRTRERRDMAARLDALALDEAAASARGAELSKAWADAWARAGILPLAPAAMLAWCKDREQLLAAQEAMRAAEDARNAIDARAAGYLRALREALSSGGAPAEELDARVLHSRAEALVAAAAARLEKGRELASARQHGDEAGRKLHALDEEEATFRGDWARRLAALGFEGDLSVAAARAVVKGLDAMRAELAREVELEDRIQKIGVDIARFEADALAVAGDLGRAPGVPAPDALRPDELIEALHADLGAARSARTAREASEKACTRSELARAERARGLELASAAVAAMRARAGARDDDELEAIVARAERRDELTARIAQHERELRHTQGPFEAFDAYVRALADADEATLREEIARREARAEILAVRVRELDAQSGSAEAALRRFAGGSEAADLAAAVEGEMATFASASRTYAVNALACAVLTDAIARFERDHQPALLGAASTLFGAMTRGRYARVFRRLSDGSLQVERADGRALEPDALSTGTREQLYLAIRLAYIADYGGRAEPLPVILDDVLVNFDEERARATLRVLASLGGATQVVLFTCHASMVALARDAVPGVPDITVPARVAH